VNMARRAALETVNAYRIRDQADLLTVAQIVAFGLAALGSLSLSMLDDLTLSMTLRLRGNANACSRSAELNRRARSPSPAGPARQAAPAIAAKPASPLAQAVRQPVDEAALVAEVAAVRRQVAAVQARMLEQRNATVEAAAPASPLTPSPVATPSVAAPITTNPIATNPVATGPHPAPSVATAPIATAPIATAPIAAAPIVAAPIAASPVAAPMTPDQQSKAMWASAMANVAAEFTAEIAMLPEAERWQAATRASALTRTARTLLSETGTPPLAAAIRTASVPPASI
jgi:hypothetical protein